MRRLIASSILLASLCGAALAQQPAVPELTLTRLDCGTSAAPSDVGRFSDVYAHQGLTLQIVYSCYLIRHGDDIMLWDNRRTMHCAFGHPVDQVRIVQRSTIRGTVAMGRIIEDGQEARRA